jgi:hypothetical protein
LAGERLAQAELKADSKADLKADSRAGRRSRRWRRAIYVAGNLPHILSIAALFVAMQLANDAETGIHAL